jgi:hypothetical protein
VPAAARTAVARSLAPVPADRWASAGQFAAALRQGSTPGRRGKARIAIGVAGVAGLVALAVFLNAGPRAAHDRGTDSVIHRARGLIANGSTPHVIEAVQSLESLLRHDSANTRAWTALATAYTWSERHGIPLPGVPAESLGPMAIRFSEHALGSTRSTATSWLARV